jgi:hypothetical protein
MLPAKLRPMHCSARPTAAEARGLGCDRLALARECAPSARHRPGQFATGRREPQVGVVLAQLQPVFGAAGEHAVRLAGALGDQVVDQHAEVGLVAARRPRLLSVARSAPR